LLTGPRTKGIFLSNTLQSSFAIRPENVCLKMNY
jgi:hypothetical protein